MRHKMRFFWEAKLHWQTMYKKLAMKWAVSISFRIDVNICIHNFGQPIRPPLLPPLMVCRRQADDCHHNAPTYCSHKFPTLEPRFTSGGFRAIIDSFWPPFLVITCFFLPTLKEEQSAVLTALLRFKQEFAVMMKVELLLEESATAGIQSSSGAVRLASLSGPCIVP